MKRLALVLVLLWTGTALAAGKKKKAPAPPAASPPPVNSPAAALAELPALPKTAQPDLECSARDALDKRLVHAREVALEQAQRAGGPTEWTDTTRDQEQALLALNDLEFSACVNDLQQVSTESWLGPSREKLDEKIMAAQTNAQAVAAANQFLKDAQPGYAAYLKQVNDCVGRRERIIATARGAHAGTSTENALQDAIDADWSLASAAADAQVEVCGTARDAARRNREPQ